MRCNRLPDIGLAYHAYFSVVCPAPTNFTSKIISYSCQKNIWRQYPVFQRAASGEEAGPMDRVVVCPTCYGIACWRSRGDIAVVALSNKSFFAQ